MVHSALHGLKSQQNSGGACTNFQLYFGHDLTPELFYKEMHS